MRHITFTSEVTATGLRIAIGGDYLSDAVVRSEGHVSMTLQKRDVSFVSVDAPLPRPHPDHLALIAILSFFPVIGGASGANDVALHFDWPVSEALQRAIDQPYILQGVRVDGRLGEVAQYAPAIDEVLSFGGGFDSVAASILFPNAIPVHESPIAVLEGRITDAVIDSAHLMPSKPRFVYTDQRYLFDVYGLPVWTGVFSSSLLYRPEVIIAGSVMDSTYLRDGKGFRPFADSNWYEVFKTLGVTIRPTSFLSEVGNARLIQQAELFDAAAYCARIPFNDCGTCIKCLRRRLLRAMNGEPFGEFSPTEAVLEELGQRPLKWGHSYGHALTTLGWLPDWMIAKLADVLVELGRDYSFQEYYLESAFVDLDYPQTETDRISDHLASAGIDPMPSEHIKRLESFQAVGSPSEGT